MFREKTVTFGGSLRASHVSFGVKEEQDDDEDDYDDDEDFESLSNEDCPEVKSDNNQFSSDFSDMKLIEFPKILQAGEKNIKYLYLQQNKLTRLPTNLFIDLPNLQWLDVRNNALRELPQLQSHKRIKTILAENNLIRSLPSDLKTARMLKCIQVTNNPLLEGEERKLSVLAQGEEPRGKNKLCQQRGSVDSGVDLTNDNDTEADTTKEEVVEKVVTEEEDIIDFIENKDLYKCNPSNSEQENFDEFLYYYKSFHSPLLDKEFPGFSMEQIRKESLRIERRKREQSEKSRVDESLQMLKSKAALKAWREKYKHLQREAERRRREGDADDDCEVTNPPYDQDPDWTVATSQLGDKIFAPVTDKSVKLEDICSAVSVLEDELDGEVERVIKSSGRPGRQDQQARLRRSARIARLNSKLETVRSKVRAVSAHPRV